MVRLLLLAFCASSAGGFTDNLRLASKQLARAQEAAQQGGDLLQQTASNASLSTAEDLVLFARQVYQCPTGTYECPNGKCCQVGTNCVQNGCCNGGKQQCGSDGCYDPATQVCCGASGNYCREGYDCVQGGCCPKGQSPCGANNCYDPETSVCCTATSRYCQKGYDCVQGGGCCPSGQLPCGSSKCYDPKTQTCCTSGGSSWGCPLGASCCNDAKSCYLPETEKCCSGGACPQRDSCCGKECCRPGATCGSNGYCTLTSTLIPTSKTTRTTSQATRSTSRAMTTSRVTTKSCSTPTLTTSQITTQTIPFVYDPNRQIVAKAGPSAGQTIPGTNEAVLWNMCRGIDKFNGGNGGNTLTLTYGGKCFKKRNRKIMCQENGISWCSNAVKSYIKQFYPTGIPSWAEEAITAAGDMQCDEFPFASSVEGGDLNSGVRICVPSDDQSFQGSSMGKYFNPKVPATYVAPGEKYVIEIVGWDCNTQTPTRKAKRSEGLQERDAFSSTGVNFTGAEMWRGFDPANPGMKLMAMPLGDLNAGEYIVNLNITGGSLNLSLVDFNGQTFDTTLLSDGSVSFSLDDDYEGVSLGGTTFDEDVGVVYQARAVSTTGGTAAVTTTGSGPAATDKSAAPRAGPCIASFLITFGALVM